MPVTGSAVMNTAVITALIAVIGLLTGQPVRAHGPEEARLPSLRCEVAASRLSCRGGWSTGDPLLLWTYHVVDDAGAVIQRGTVDRGGRFTVDRPRRPFAILVVEGDGSGQSVELHGSDIPVAEGVDATEAAEGEGAGHPADAGAATGANG